MILYQNDGDNIIKLLYSLPPTFYSKEKNLALLSSGLQRNENVIRLQTNLVHF